MRIGIDAHIIVPKHKRHDPKIARFTENLIKHLIEADKKQEHTWVLFFDRRMKGDKKLEEYSSYKNVEIKHFPFVQYRQYMPVLYSHMLVSSFLRSAKLDVFHSPEGLIPFVYPGKIITTFNYVPKGKVEASLFARTFMLGARAAFAQLCKRAKRIIVFSRADKKLLVEKHKYPADRVVVYEAEDIERIDWSSKVQSLMKVYKEVATKKAKKKKPAKKKAAKEKKPKKPKKTKAPKTKKAKKK